MLDAESTYQISSIKYQVTPNGLAFSGRLEGWSMIGREDAVSLLNRKNAPIQPLRCNAWLGAILFQISSRMHCKCIQLLASDYTLCTPVPVAPARHSIHEIPNCFISSRASSAQSKQ